MSLLESHALVDGKYTLKKKCFHGSQPMFFGPLAFVTMRDFFMMSQLLIIREFNKKNN
jgi:hypothetical protein